MKYIYFVIWAILIIGVIYCGGFYSGRNGCRVRVAAQTLNVQTEIIKKQREINAETVNTAVCDIRRVLREKYTIAD